MSFQITQSNEKTYNVHVERNGTENSIHPIPFIQILETF